MDDRLAVFVKSFGPAPIDELPVLRIEILREHQIKPAIVIQIRSDYGARAVRRQLNNCLRIWTVGPAGIDERLGIEAMKRGAIGEDDIGIAVAVDVSDRAPTGPAGGKIDAPIRREPVLAALVDNAVNLAG